MAAANEHGEAMGLPLTPSSSWLRQYLLSVTPAQGNATWRVGARCLPTHEDAYGLGSLTLCNWELRRRPRARVRHKGVDRVGVRQCVQAQDIVALGALEDLLDRELELLAGQRAGDGRDRLDRVGHVPRRKRRAQRAGDLRAQLVVQIDAVVQVYEQHQLAGPALRVLQVDDQAVRHLGQVL